MGGVKRFLAGLGGLAVAVLAVGLPAVASAADPVDDAVSTLRSNHVYVASGVPTKVDQDAVRRAAGAAPIYLAVLPDSVGNPVQVALRIGKALGDGTVGVVAGHDFGASSDQLCPGAVGTVTNRVLADNRDALRRTNDVTQLLSDFAADVITAPRRGRDCADASGQSSSDASAAGSSSGGSAWPWVLGFGTVGVLGAAGGGAYLLSRRRRRLRELEGRRAEVLSLYDRLGGDVQNLDPGDDPVARQALADAAERYTATGSLLSHADTDGEYDAARRTALEGLQAARTARTTLGLDPGPELPPIGPARGEQLTEAREVTVEGKTYQGHPQYTPGAPYYYGGGAGVPGGWYGVPFWETLLLGSVLAGGLGGWGGGGGYDSGYDQGFEAGRDSADQGGGGWDGGGDTGGGWDTGGGGWDSGGDSGGGWDSGGGDTGGGGW